MENSGFHAEARYAWDWPWLARCSLCTWTTATGRHPDNENIMKTQSTQPSQNAEKRVTILNSLLRGELSAVETYDQAIRQLAGERIPELAENRDCHAGRVDALRREITALGGEPAKSSGAWGGFAKLVEKGASVAGRSAILATHEEGEDRGLADYRKAREDLDANARTSIDTDLLPAQKRTHERMSRLQQTA